MIDYAYFIVRQILMVLFLYMGLHMLFVRLRGEIKNTDFYYSFRVMGIAFMFISLSCFIHTLQNRLDSLPYMSIAVNLTACYSIFMMMSKAFLILLGKTMSRKSKAIIYGLIAIFPIPLWVGIEFGDTEIIYRVVTASYTYFVINIALLSIYILKTHDSAIKNIGNVYSEDIAISLNWISKSKRLFVGLVVVCVLTPALFLSPRWLRFIFMTYAVLCYCRTYYGYQSMMMDITCHFIKKNRGASRLTTVSQNAIEGDNIPLSPEVRDLISTRLEEWVSQRGYTQNSLTMSDVARFVGTNRTYLSRYINATYNYSFRAWITELRIEEAKRLLSSDLDLMVNSISTSIGFASTDSFIHVFTRSVGQPPDKWRKAHL